METVDGSGVAIPPTLSAQNVSIAAYNLKLEKKFGRLKKVR